ncbi:MAG: hypothetical protein AMXMBFR13_47320 [Phycisphaerae bacterium]
MRLLYLCVALAVLFALPLLIFQDRFDAAIESVGGAAWLRGYGSWAWAAAIGLQVADLVLPVPATVIMAGLGVVYGPVLGGLIGAAGSMLAGALAYGAARLLGRPAARFLVGERDLEQARGFFARAGGWAVAVSRPMPLLAEVSACLAGLAGMPSGRFFPALACGALPLGLAFATLGYSGSDRPALAVVISALAPLALWPVARWLVRPSSADSGGDREHVSAMASTRSSEPSP